MIKYKEVMVCVCDKCGKEWTPTVDYPKYCPGCKNPRWNDIAEKAKKAEEEQDSKINSG